mgnify:FL=1
MFIHDHLKRAVLVLGLCLFCAIGSSCVVIPAKPLNEIIIGEEKLASVEVGRDDRASLTRLLGDPLLRSEDDSRWIYRTRIFNTSESKFCAPASQSFYCERRGITHQEFLDARFTPDGILGSFATTATDESGCTHSGVCVGDWPRELALYAMRQTNDRPDHVPQDMCAIYAYLGSDNLAPSFALQLGVDQPVLWVQQQDFVYIVEPPGKKRVWAISENELMDSQGWATGETESASWMSLDVNCGPNEVRYFVLNYGTKVRQKIVEVENARGEQEVAKRRQLVSMFVSGLPFVQPVTPGMKR